MSLLDVLLATQEISDVIQPAAVTDIPLCRHRDPPLPPAAPDRPVVCAILDCAVLWLRHNLAKRFPVHPYTLCIRICYRVLFAIAEKGLRVEYNWKGFWDALLGLLNFLTSRLDDLATTGGVEVLLREVCWRFDAYPLQLHVQ